MMEEDKKLKIYLGIALASLIVIGVFGGKTRLEGTKSLRSFSEVGEEVVSADLELDFGEGETKTYEDVKTQEETVLGLLLAAAQESDFEVDYSESEMGAFVKAISGVENTKEKFWQFWLNGEYGQVAMDKQEIKDGDLVEIKLTSFEQ